MADKSVQPSSGLSGGSIASQAITSQMRTFNRLTAPFAPTGVLIDENADPTRSSRFQRMTAGRDILKIRDLADKLPEDLKQPML